MRGRDGSQSWPVTPFLDVLTWHSNNALEEERKLAHNCYEIQPSIPCLTNESSKAGAGKNWTVHPLAFAFDAWKACKLLNAGCNFHSVEGMKGEPYTEEHLDWLRETIRGIDSLPSSCQNLPYVHRQDLEPPGIIRATRETPAPIASCRSAGPRCDIRQPLEDRRSDGSGGDDALGAGAGHRADGTTGQGARATAGVFHGHWEVPPPTPPAMAKE